MVDTVSTPGLWGAATDDKDGPSDDDPGPSPFSLIIASEDWHALGDVEAAVRCACSATAEKTGVFAGREVTIALSSDAEVAALNAQYRGKNAPTNVLSFPAADLPGGDCVFGARRPLGDIILAYETVAREAADDNKPPLHHLSHLVIHGLLHLAGYDHETDQEAARMEQIEREILAGLGVPDPYSPISEETPISAG